MRRTHAVDSRPARTVLGLGLVAASLAFAAIVAGTGFAGNSTSAAEYEYGNGKVLICHHTHSKQHPAVTISIAPSAWKAHRRHGDTEGACTTATPTSSAPAVRTTPPQQQHGKGHRK